jgi:glycosyltransferase involved in cell wall biosynthesis
VNIVVLSPSLLGNSAASGGEVSALGFLKDIASRHRLHVIVFDEQSGSVESARAAREMEEWAASVRVVPLRMTIGRKLAARARKMFFVPKSVTRHSSGAFRQACKETLAKYPIDLAVIQFPKMAQYVDQFPGIPKVMDVQDAYSVSVFRAYAAASSLCILARLYAARNWLSWLRYECRYYKMFDHLFVVSEQDNYGLRVFNPGLKITVLPRMMSLSASSCVTDNPPFDLGFIGSYSHKPNIRALRYLFDSVLPLLVAQMPGVRVLIAGREPPKELVERAPGCVTFAGFVPTVGEFYRQIGVVVAPVVTGGGVKIKVIEGLLSGLPVVTTSIGAEGIGLTDGVDALIADDAASFAGAIVKLARNAGYRGEIGAAGRTHAMTLGSPELHARLVEGVFASVRKQAAAVSPGV